MEEIIIICHASSGVRMDIKRTKGTITKDKIKELVRGYTVGLMGRSNK